ncbi:gp53-like domain-containing protein [Citrobacter europaeus]|uniref:gp53-like domain-containing protein n=1 Tax=Citrobacter europaeus TaxID=1914243 RepID=UPI001F383118|nr:phage tail protein [Citrobacter europaeus]MDT7086217.1 phage tail protein [Citrobacter europaeus]
MAINDFKPFATGPGANVMPQADWEALPALLSGFMSGKASSAQINKAIRQAAFIAAALAQYTANKSGEDVLDDGDVAGFIAKMSSAFGKDYQPLDATLTTLAGLATGANKLPYFTGADAAALTALTSIGRDIIGKTSVADVLTYLGLKEAAKRDVGTGANQIPDMSSFAMSMGQTGRQLLPSGMLIQWGVIALGNDGNAFGTLPVAFPNSIHGGFAGEAAPTGWASNSCVVAAFDLAQSSRTGVTVRARSIVGTGGPTTSTSTLSVRYFCWGY